MSELAILGGPKTRTEAYPAWPVWDERDVQAVAEVVRDVGAGIRTPGQRLLNWQRNLPSCKVVAMQYP